MSEPNNNTAQFDEVLRMYAEFKARRGYVIGEAAVNAFKKNIRDQGFFGTPWAQSSHQPANRAGRNALIKSGNLRRSIHIAAVTPDRVYIVADEPYAKVQNEGAVIQVTLKMRRFFYAMYKQTGDDFWKGMLCAKQIVIPKRQFMGDNPALIKAIDRKISWHIQNIFKQVKR